MSILLDINALLWQTLRYNFDFKENWWLSQQPLLGREVRAAIAKIGVAMPENIPSAEPIKNVEKRFKKAKPKLLLDDKNSSLLPENSSNNLKP